MNIIVCIKQVPDTETIPRLESDEKGIKEEGVNFCLNPYDEYAVEEAIRIKERLEHIEETKVTLIAVGPERSRSALLSGLAMGADEAIFYLDPNSYRFDSFQVSNLLFRIISGLKFDLILCGKQAVDDDNCQVPQMLAEDLAIPQATFAVKIEFSEDRKNLIVEREIEKAIEVLELDLPGLVTVEKGINIPRYPSLTNILKAKKKPIRIISSKDIEVLSPKTDILKFYYPPERKPGKIIKGEPEETVKELIALLRQEAKVI